MNAPRRPGPSPGAPSPEGAAAWTPSLALLAVALGIVVGALAWWWNSPPVPAERSAAAAPALPPARPVASGAAPPMAPPPAVVLPGSLPAVQPRVAAPVAAPRIARQRDRDGDQTPDLSDYINEGERPTMGEVIQRLHQAGVRSGLGAFSPPGTRPPLAGLAVPEGFVLPDGYVRHYQATDDGERLEPILMFAPDRQFVDQAGRPVAVPGDRVVPPELAPPGLPLRRIVIPPAATPGTSGS